MSSPRSLFVVALVACAAVGVLPSASAGPAREPTIAFVRFEPRSEHLRILVGPLGGATRRAVRLPTSDAQGPALSPDRRRLAFVGGTGVNEARVLETDVDLWVARVDGRGARRLTRDRIREASPAWSPDGKSIAFVRSARRGNRSSLWVVGSQSGSVARRLTAGGIDLQPSWSRDGRRIVFVRIDARYESAVWELRSDGTGLRRLAGLTGVTRPAWSPDGTRILVTDGSTLFTARPDGGDRRLVVRLDTDVRGARVDPQPSWSRSGWIVFTQLRAGTSERSDIWRVRPDGTRLARVTSSPAFDGEPSLSP